MNDKHVHDFCKCLEILLNHESTNEVVMNIENEECKSRPLLLKNILKTRIIVLLDCIEKYPSVNEYICDWAPSLKAVESADSIIWAFTLWCSVLFFGIKKHLDLKSNEGLKNYSLSVGDQKTFLSGVQFVIRLGVWPNLVPSLGKSVCRGSQFGVEISKEEISCYDSYRRLIFSLTVFASLLNQPILKTVIVSNHLFDLLAALGQICHAPIKKIKETKAVVDSKTEEGSITIHNFLENFNADNFRKLLALYLEKYNATEFEFIKEMWHDRWEFDPIFEKLQNTVYQPLLVRDLLQLQRLSELSKLKWLKSMCGHLLSSTLLRHNGVVVVVNGILQNISDDNTENSDYVKYEKIAMLISQPPIQCESADLYFSKICPQVINLLSTEVSNQAVTKICSSILNHMFENNSTSCWKYFIKPIIKPLLKAVDTDVNQREIIVKEQELEKCINIFTKIFNSNLEVNEILVQQVLQQLFHFFFKLYVNVYKGSFHLKNKVYNLVIFSLNNSDSKIELLNCAAFDDFKQLPNVLRLRIDVKFCYGEEGGIYVKTIDESDCKENAIEMIDQSVSALCSLLDGFSDKNAVQDWFMILLDKLSAVLEKEETPSEKGVLSNLTLVTLIPNLVDIVSPSLCKDSSKIIRFIRSTLNRTTQYTSDEFEDNPFKSLLNESAFMALSIMLTLTLQGDQMSSKDWSELTTCGDYLEKLESLHQGKVLGNLAKEIQLTIESRGIIEPTVEKLSHAETNLTPFQLAWINLQDSLIPTKGNALIKLKNLILERDPEALEKRKTLFTIFEEHLGHEDSYIYLTAIQALSALALIYTDDILPSLSFRYANFNSQDDSVEFRLKLGEALVQTCKNLGDMIHKYGKLLLQCFLTTCKHEDHHLRASSLVNLGEVCKLLKFSLGSSIQEILTCLTSLSLSDQSVEVRRSSVMVLTLLLRGLGRDVFCVLEKELLSVYRHLKKVYEIEKDEIIQIHVEQAMGEIKIAMENLLTPSNELIKEIKVLDLS